MKAVRLGRCGPPEVLELRDIGMSVGGGDRVPVRVGAAPVNLLDRRFMVGAP
jgi:NADPH:quinone reductase-like Zn-dependent oxidoreductase